MKQKTRQVCGKSEQRRGFLSFMVHVHGGLGSSLTAQFFLEKGHLGEKSQLYSLGQVTSPPCASIPNVWRWDGADNSTNIPGCCKDEMHVKHVRSALWSVYSSWALTTIAIHAFQRYHFRFNLKIIQVVKIGCWIGSVTIPKSCIFFLTIVCIYWFPLKWWLLKAHYFPYIKCPCPLQKVIPISRHTKFGVIA